MKSKIIFYLMKKYGLGVYRVEDTNSTFEITKNGPFQNIAVHIDMGHYLTDDSLNNEIDKTICELEKLIQAESDKLTQKMLNAINMTVMIQHIEDIF